MKKCNRCLDDKEESLFYKGNAICKKCKIEQSKTYVEDNKEKIKEYKKEYREKNSLAIKDKSKEYYNENSDYIKAKASDNYLNNKSRKIEYQKEYAKNNKEKISIYKRKYQNDRRKNDPIFRLKFIISRMIRNSLKSNGFTKGKRSTEILGCTIDEFKYHIESRFINDMSWDNYGIVWDIDHIIPICTAVTEEDVVKLNHYTNLQPLDSHINRNIKRDRLDFYK